MTSEWISYLHNWLFLCQPGSTRVSGQKRAKENHSWTQERLQALLHSVKQWLSQPRLKCKVKTGLTLWQSWTSWFWKIASWLMDISSNGGNREGGARCWWGGVRPYLEWLLPVLTPTSPSQPNLFFLSHINNNPSNTTSLNLAGHKKDRRVITVMHLWLRPFGNFFIYARVPQSRAVCLMCLPVSLFVWNSFIFPFLICNAFVVKMK